MNWWWLVLKVVGGAMFGRKGVGKGRKKRKSNLIIWPDNAFKTPISFFGSLKSVPVVLFTHRWTAYSTEVGHPPLVVDSGLHPAFCQRPSLSTSYHGSLIKHMVRFQEPLSYEYHMRVPCELQSKLSCITDRGRSSVFQLEL